MRQQKGSQGFQRCIPYDSSEMIYQLQFFVHLRIEFGVEIRIQRARKTGKEAGYIYEFPREAQLGVADAPPLSSTGPLLVRKIHGHGSPKPDHIIQQEPWHSISGLLQVQM